MTFIVLNFLFCSPLLFLKSFIMFCLQYAKCHKHLSNIHISLILAMYPSLWFHNWSFYPWFSIPIVLNVKILQSFKKCVDSEITWHCTMHCTFVDTPVQHSEYISQAVDTVLEPVVCVMHCTFHCTLYFYRLPLYFVIL